MEEAVVLAFPPPPGQMSVFGIVRTSSGRRWSWQPVDKIPRHSNGDASALAASLHPPTL